MTPPRSGWPPLMRAMLLLALTCGIMVSVSAAQDAAVALSIDSLNPPEMSLGALREYVPFAKEQEAALKAQGLATLGAIEHMAGARAAVMVALAGVAMLIFLTAMQIRWSPERPHVRLARRLGVLGILAAVLRTLDGAQGLIIVQRAADASGKVLLEARVPDAEATVAFTRSLVVAGSVGWTVIVVAMFVAISTWFRSAGAQAGFDATPDEE